jgi:thiaminase/transcriptional activator TenA
MESVTRVLALGLLCCAAQGQEFTAGLWEGVRPIYEKTIRHPFLAGLASGELPREKFDFYLEQDSLYLGAFSRALLVLAAKAPREEWSLLFGRHAAEALVVERSLHQSLLGSGHPAAGMAPTTRAYTNHLLAVVYQRPFVEGLAALLPCYWIYWEVGRTLKAKGSREPAYQRWIDQYAGEDYGRTVEEVLAVMNEAARAESPAVRDACRKHFELSARYEYLFWDMAWRLEAWAP